MCVYIIKSDNDDIKKSYIQIRKNFLFCNVNFNIDHKKLKYTKEKNNPKIIKMIPTNKKINFKNIFMDIKMKKIFLWKIEKKLYTITLKILKNIRFDFKKDLKDMEMECTCIRFDLFHIYKCFKRKKLNNKNKTYNIYIFNFENGIC